MVSRIAQELGEGDVSGKDSKSANDGGSSGEKSPLDATSPAGARSNLSATVTRNTNLAEAEDVTIERSRGCEHAKEALPGALGAQLKSVYGELLSAPVPDKILDLIKQLEGRAADEADREEGGQ